MVVTSMVMPWPASAKPACCRSSALPMPPAATTTTGASTWKGWPRTRPRTPPAWRFSMITSSTRASVITSQPAATASSTHSAAFHLAPQRQPSMHLAPQSKCLLTDGRMNLISGSQL